MKLELAQTIYAEAIDFSMKAIEIRKETETDKERGKESVE